MERDLFCPSKLTQEVKSTNISSSLLFTVKVLKTYQILFIFDHRFSLYPGASLLTEPLWEPKMYSPTEGSPQNHVKRTKSKNSWLLILWGDFYESIAEAVSVSQSFFPVLINRIYSERTVLFESQKIGSEYRGKPIGCWALCSQ